MWQSPAAGTEMLSDGRTLRGVNTVRQTVVPSAISRSHQVQPEVIEKVGGVRGDLADPPAF
jgi:hypothetical protein